MNRPDPIEYAERLYDAICAANFSPISFLTFGNAVKDGVPLRNLPRIAAEPFMRIVGEMLELEEAAAEEDSLFDVELTPIESVPAPGAAAGGKHPSASPPPPGTTAAPVAAQSSDQPGVAPTSAAAPGGGDDTPPAATSGDQPAEGSLVGHGGESRRRPGKNG